MNHILVLGYLISVYIRSAVSVFFMLQALFSMPFKLIPVNGRNLYSLHAILVAFPSYSKHNVVINLHDPPTRQIVLMVTEPVP